MGKMPEAQNFLIPPRKCANCTTGTISAVALVGKSANTMLHVFGYVKQIAGPRSAIGRAPDS